MNLEDFNRFKEKRVLVVGDYCIDEFIQGDLNENCPVSPEAPILRISVDEIRTSLGMAGNIAAGLRALEAETYVAGVVGDDESSKKMLSLFHEKEINYDKTAVYQEERLTPKFTRVLAGGRNYPPQEKIRYDIENCKPVSDETREKMISRIETLSPILDAVIVADYDEVGKGLINEYFLQGLRKFSKQEKLFLFGDSRTNFSQFYGFNCIKPNASELKQLYSEKDSVEEAVEKAICRLDLESILVTKDSQGMEIFSRDSREVFPAFNKNPASVDGAGDTVSCAFTLGMISGLGYKDSAKIASYAAAISVSKPGVDVVKLDELKNYFSKMQNG